MKLRGFVWSILGIEGCMVLWLFITKSYSEAIFYFLGTLTLLAAGLELVRAELAKLRRTSTAQDKS